MEEEQKPARPDVPDDQAVLRDWREGAKKDKGAVRSGHRGGACL